ncbi:MAG: hypothetical protein A2031_07830 [Deltaproteobacteria bacterium RBG_19FT_COMBO_43_11]|nr:MAG: hypothetical protein A2031_07830 [Deltaproteobacteria bacterium RBG_19FT_COMBO_43_11]
MSRSQCHIISTEKAFLDSPVSSTGQALRRASLEFIRRMLDGMTKMVIATQSRKPESRKNRYLCSRNSFESKE